MTYKLIKVEDEYYLTTEVKVVEGEYGVIFAHGIGGVGRGWHTYYHDGKPGHKLNAICVGSRKITHSTAPIDGDEVGGCFNTVKQLSLSNCHIIEYGYDLDELAEKNTSDCDASGCYPEDVFKDGFQKAIEIRSDKKYSKEDLVMVWDRSADYRHNPTYKNSFEECVNSLQQTEWDVEIVMGDPIGIGDKYTPDTKPKLDGNGCIILKKIKE